MSYKILTVDDSKSLRMIVKKAFKAYDVDILEAENGKEGVSLAESKMPDLILLDITMPEMDGVQALGKLKENIKTKNIPVIMLTAEACKERVIEIAKMGVKDYIVKPLNDELLIEKVKRQLDLKRIKSQKPQPKTILDECEILVIEEKENILKQLEEAISKKPWTVIKAKGEQSAKERLKESIPHAVIVNLNLDNEEAYKLGKEISNTEDTKDIPLIGLCLPNREEEEKQAKRIGYRDFIHKPINQDEIEECLVKNLKLDDSVLYFKDDGENLIISIPDKISPKGYQSITNLSKPKIVEAIESGYRRVYTEFEGEANFDTIKLLMNIESACREYRLEYIFIANKAAQEHCKSTFEEAKDWKFYTNIESAKQEPAIT